MTDERQLRDDEIVQVGDLIAWRDGPAPDTRRPVTPGSYAQGKTLADIRRGDRAVIGVWRVEASEIVEAVAIGLLDDRGRVLLLRRASTGFGDGAWCLPGGRVEPGETYAEAIVREAREELGVEVTAAPYRDGEVRTKPDGVRYRMHYFRGAIVHGTPRNVETHKHDALEWFPLDALPAPMLPGDREVLTT